jgi:hypothetical protein
LCILDVNSLSNEWPAKLFSHSVRIVSFDLDKLFNLI